MHTQVQDMQYTALEPDTGFLISYVFFSGSLSIYFFFRWMIERLITGKREGRREEREMNVWRIKQK